jgi:hypothetical protein
MIAVSPPAKMSLPKSKEAYAKVRRKENGSEKASASDE